MKKFLLFFSVLMGCSAEEKNAEDNLRTALVTFDTLLRKSKTEYDKIDGALLDVDSLLMHEESKNFYGSWETLGKFKWNEDSSVVMVSSIKKHKDGFKREIILNIKDTSLFVRRFDVLTESNDQFGYEIFEELQYLTGRHKIKAVVRRVYPRALKDTVELAKMPFTNIETDEDLYSLEMEYLRRIMTRN